MRHAFKILRNLNYCISEFHYRQRRRAFCLVIDGHVSVLPRAAGAGDDAGEVGAGGGVGVL